MILNSKNSNFIFNFPKNFIYNNIQERYKTYLKRLPLPYDSVSDYMNASIQSITFPGGSVENTEQMLYEDKVKWKGGLDVNNQINKEFTITFKNYEGYINYWIMFDLFLEFNSYDNDREFLPDVNISFLDHSGYEFIVFEYKQLLFNEISELELNFSSNISEFQNFTCSFTYNYFNIKRRSD